MNKFTIEVEADIEMSELERIIEKLFNEAGLECYYSIEKN